MSHRNYDVAGQKLAQAKRLLERYDIDCWLIISREGTDPSFELMTGQSSIHQAVCLVDRNGRHRIFCSQSDFESYRESGLYDVIAYETSLAEILKDALQKASPNRLALNVSQHDPMCDGLTLGQYMWLEQIVGPQQLMKIEVSSEDVLSELRSIKTPSEIERVKQAVSQTMDIFEDVFRDMRCGMTEIQVGELFVDAMRKRGLTSGLGKAYDPPLVCAVRHGLAHRKPSDYVISPGDIVIIDSSVRYEQYVSDIARTCYVTGPDGGGVPDDVRHAFDTAIAAITAGINALQPGAKGFEVDAAARQVIEAGGYPTIRHATGHQVGKECHDGGTILGPRREVPRPQVERAVRPNEIYAVEPTVIQDGGLPCMLVEENILVTDAGPVVLSQRQLDLVVIDR